MTEYISPAEARRRADAGDTSIPDAVRLTGRPMPSIAFDPVPLAWEPSPDLVRSGYLEPRRVIHATTPAEPGDPTAFWAKSRADRMVEFDRLRDNDPLIQGVLNQMDNSVRVETGNAFWTAPRPSEEDRITEILDQAVNRMARAAMERREEQLKVRFQREIKLPPPLCMPPRDLRQAGDVAVWSWPSDPWDHSEVARVAAKHLDQPPAPLAAPQCAQLPAKDWLAEFDAEHPRPALFVQYHHGVPPGTAWLVPKPVPFAAPYPEEIRPMPTITEFLEARISEDEALALAAIADDQGNDCGFTVARLRELRIAEDASKMISHLTPRRLLADCHAKREIIAEANLGTPPAMTDKEMHTYASHPGWEYATTEGQRKCWDDQNTPPDGEGWERNMDRGRDGWDRFDYTEESYWRRPRPGGPRKPYINRALRALASVYADHQDYQAEWA